MTLFDSVEFFAEMKGLKWKTYHMPQELLRSHVAAEGVIVWVTEGLSKDKVERHLVRSGDIYGLYNPDGYTLKGNYHSHYIINLLRILEG